MHLQTQFSSLLNDFEVNSKGSRPPWLGCNARGQVYWVACIWYGLTLTHPKLPVAVKVSVLVLPSLLISFLAVITTTHSLHTASHQASGLFRYPRPAIPRCFLRGFQPLSLSRSDPPTDKQLDIKQDRHRGTHLGGCQTVCSCVPSHTH